MAFARKTWAPGDRMNLASINDFEQRISNVVADRGLLPFNVREYGAAANNTTDDTSAIQSAITAAVAAGGGEVFFPRGTYYVGTTKTATGLTWILEVIGSNVHLNFEPGATLRTDQNAKVIWAVGAGKPSGSLSWANYWLGDATKATYYGISAATRGQRTVTLTVSGDSSNFVVGDYVYIRTGQCNSTTVTEPDAELNQIIAISAGVMTLRWPLSKDFQQEYYISGTTGKTSTTVTANLAPFGIAKVTDRVITNFKMSNATIVAPNTASATADTMGVIGVDVTDYTCTTGGNAFNNIECRNVRFRRWKVRSKPTTTGTYRWVFAFGTGCTDAVVEDIDAIGEGSRMLAYHIHEGTRDLTMRRCQLFTPAGNDDITPVSVRARSGNVVVDDVSVLSEGTQTPIFVSDECPAGGEIRNSSGSCATADKGILVTSPGWKIRNVAPLTTVRQTGTARFPGVPSTNVEWLTGVITFDNPTIVLGTLPLNTVVLWPNILLTCDVAFNSDGTDRVTVGWDASTGAILISAAALDLGTTGRKDITNTVIGSFAGTRNAAVRTMKAYFTAGGSAATAGKATLAIPYLYVPELT